MNKKLFVYLYIFLLIIICQPVSKLYAKDYYVSSFGAGKKDGSSLSNSWSGFSNVRWGKGSDKVGPWDTLYVCGEINETLRIPVSGTQSNPITISGKCPGNRGIISGAEIFDHWQAVTDKVKKAKCNWIPNLIIEEDKLLTFLNCDTDEEGMIETIKKQGPGTWSYNKATNTVYGYPVNQKNPVLEVTKREAHQGIVYALGVSNIIIEELIVKNSNSSGIKISSDSSNIIIRNNRIYNTFKWGILIERSKNITINDNEVYKTCLKYPTGGEGIRIYKSNVGQIYNNRIHDVHNCGIDLIDNTTSFKVHSNLIYDLVAEDSLNAIYSDNAQKNCYYNNFIYNIPNGVGISLSSETPRQPSQYNYVFNNIIVNAKSGILLGGSYRADEIRSANNFIYNNLVYDCGIWSELLIGESSRNETIKNNIFFRKGQGSVLTANGILGHSIDYNIWYRSDGYKYIFTWNGKVYDLDNYQLVSEQDKHSLNTDPLVIIREYPEIPEILPNSPAIDRGVAVEEVKFDFRLIPRPQGESYDIGPYEFNKSKQ